MSKRMETTTEENNNNETKGASIEDSYEDDFEESESQSEEKAAPSSSPFHVRNFLSFVSNFLPLFLFYSFHPSTYNYFTLNYHNLEIM